ncbi:hypothetical protein ACLOJK_022016, partial [Asimina triloba]
TPKFVHRRSTCYGAPSSPPRTAAMDLRRAMISRSESGKMTTMFTSSRFNELESSLTASTSFGQHSSVFPNDRENYHRRCAQHLIQAIQSIDDETRTPDPFRQQPVSGIGVFSSNSGLAPKNGTNPPAASSGRTI